MEVTIERRQTRAGVEYAIYDDDYRCIGTAYQNRGKTHWGGTDCAGRNLAPLYGTRAQLVKVIVGRAEHGGRLA